MEASTPINHFFPTLTMHRRGEKDVSWLFQSQLALLPQSSIWRCALCHTRFQNELDLLHHNKHAEGCHAYHDSSQIQTNSWNIPLHLSHAEPNCSPAERLNLQLFHAAQSQTPFNHALHHHASHHHVPQHHSASLVQFKRSDIFEKLKHGDHYRCRICLHTLKTVPRLEHHLSWCVWSNVR